MGMELRLRARTTYPKAPLPMDLMISQPLPQRACRISQNRRLSPPTSFIIQISIQMIRPDAIWFQKIACLALESVSFILFQQIHHNLHLMYSNSIVILYQKNRNMSIVRKGSKTTLRVTPEDLAASLDQKNSLISALQLELEKLRVNQEKFDRVKEQLSKARFRYECLLKDQQTSTNNGQERLDLSARNVQELRIQAEQLSDQMKLRAQALREVRQKTQELVDFSNQKEDESTEMKIKLQEQKSFTDGLKLEEERVRVQVGQLREELDKNRKENSIIRCQNDSISEKCFKTQSYIRGLLREEASLNESLSRVEDENLKLDSDISELGTMISINDSTISEKEKDCQELLFMIASKELERKKIDNEAKEKVKQLGAEKQKWRLLSEQWEQKKQESMRVEAHLAQASSDINFILTKNNEISEMNERLSDDLKVCQKHQENVQRINKNLDLETQHLKETSLKAISKLQEPFSFKSNQLPFSNIQNMTKWSYNSKMADQTNDYDWKSERA